MKRLFFLFAALVSMSALWADSATEMWLGYCDNQVAKSGNGDFAADQTDAWVSEAIYLPAEKLAPFVGNQITAIRAGVGGTVNVDSLVAWVRTDLNGENLAFTGISKSTTPKFSKGWNTVPLAEPIDITSDLPGLYLGYSCHQSQKALCLSIITAADLDTNENGLWVKLGDEDWSDRHDEGTASVEAVITGDNLPQCNLSLTALNIPAGQLTISRGVMQLTASVKNRGAVTVTGFDLICSFEDADAEYATHFETDLEYNNSVDLKFTIYPDCYETADDLMHTVKVTVANIDQGADYDTTDNSMSAEIALVQKAYERQILLEEFTTENCINCPSMAELVHTFLETDDYDERVNAVCHHSAYYTDWLTIDADESFMWFFNSNSTFAPALMFDRLTADYTIYDNDKSPISFPSSVSDFIAIADRRLALDAMVDLNIQAVLPDEAEEISITVTGERAIENFTAQPPRIVVTLVEDSVNAKNQSGYGRSFIHMHVNRAYNSTWGDVIEWSGDEFTYTCSLPVDESYNRDHLYVVAYVWNDDPNYVENCEVINSRKLRIKDFGTSSISNVSIESTSAVPCAYYTLDGLRLTSPQPGINIVKYTDGSSRKIYHKQ